jgi:hypothetical protein
MCIVDGIDRLNCASKRETQIEQQTNNETHDIGKERRLRRFLGIVLELIEIIVQFQSQRIVIVANDLEDLDQRRMSP